MFISRRARVPQLEEDARVKLYMLEPKSLSQILPLLPQPGA